MSTQEIALARACYDRGQKPSDIAGMLGRDKSVLTRLLCKQKPRRRQGRPALLQGPEVDLLQRRLHELTVKANGEKTVTVAQLKKATKCRASPKVILEALHKRNIFFRKLREKPVLTPEDVRARLAFARTYRNKSAAWWMKNVHAFIDGKHFQVYLNSSERSRAAQHATYGAYRQPGKGLSVGYVKPKTGNLRHNTGAKGVLLHLGIGAGKVVTVHEVKDSRWSGQAAVSFYEALRADLGKQHPGKRKFTVLEDNDPTGYKSQKGKEAKVAGGINILEIPKRSPDLSLCDYAI